MIKRHCLVVKTSKQWFKLIQHHSGRICVSENNLLCLTQFIFHFLKVENLSYFISSRLRLQ